MPTLDLFVYGTLRSEYGLPGTKTIVRELAPNHVQSGLPGEWVLDDYGLFCVKPDGRVGIPAIGPLKYASVVGDVIKVNAADFTELCYYEGFPRLYELIGVEVYSNDRGSYRQAFAFAPVNAEQFGGPLPGGDYIAGLARESDRPVTEDDNDVILSMF